MDIPCDPQWAEYALLQSDQAEGSDQRDDATATYCSHTAHMPDHTAYATGFPTDHSDQVSQAYLSTTKSTSAALLQADAEAASYWSGKLSAVAPAIDGSFGSNGDDACPATENVPDYFASDSAWPCDPSFPQES